MSDPTPSRTPARPPWTVRVAGWSARHRWPVFALWFVFTFGIFAVSLAAGGTDSAAAVSNNQSSRFELARAYEVFGAGTATNEEPSQQLLLVVGARTGTVDDPANAAAITDVVTRLGALTSTVAGASAPTVDQLVDPLTAPATADLVSPDRSTVRIPSRALGEGDTLEQRLEPVPAFVDEMRVAHPNLTIHALNNHLANADIQELVNGGLDASLRLTIPLTFLILLIAFGAVVAAVVPLVMAVTSLMAAFGILALYSRFVSPASPYASQLIVLIGLAVAVDYSLFMVTRFRTERRHGRSKLAAIDVASATAGRAVFFSGLAVMVSIGGLFLLDDPLFRVDGRGDDRCRARRGHRVADLPAGDVRDPRRRAQPVPPADPGSRPGGGERLLGPDRPLGDAPPGAGGPAGRHVPVVLAAPALRLRLGQADFTSFPDSIEGVQALNILNEKWPTGTTLSLDIVVTKADEPATKTAIEALSTRVLAIPGVSRPDEDLPFGRRPRRDDPYVMSGGSNDESNRQIVREVRREIVPEVFGACPAWRPSCQATSPIRTTSSASTRTGCRWSWPSCCSCRSCCCSWPSARS